MKRPNGRQRVVGDFTVPDEPPQSVEHVISKSANAGVDCSEENGSVCGEKCADLVGCFVVGVLVPVVGRGTQLVEGVGQKQSNAAIVVAECAAALPDNFSRRAEFIQLARPIFGEPRRKDVAFEARCRER